MIGPLLMMGACGGAGGGGGLPVTDGLWAHYDASDESSIDDSTNAGRAEQWDDLSGNGRHLTSSGTARPYTGGRTHNSLNVLDFQGAQSMSVASSISVGDFTIYAIFDDDTGTPTNGGWIGLNAGTGDDWNRTDAIVFENGNASQQCSMITNTTQAAVITGAGGITTDPALFQLIKSTDVGSSSSISRTHSGSGTSAVAALTSSGTASGLHIGTRYLSGTLNASFAIDGLMGEIVVFSRVLDSGERTDMVDYLLDKWGITGP